MSFALCRYHSTFHSNSTFGFPFLLIKSHHMRAKKPQTTMREVRVIQEPQEVNTLATKDLQNRLCVFLVLIAEMA